MQKSCQLVRHDLILLVVTSSCDCTQGSKTSLLNEKVRHTRLRVLKRLISNIETPTYHGASLICASVCKSRLSRLEILSLDRASLLLSISSEQHRARKPRTHAHTHTHTHTHTYVCRYYMYIYDVWLWPRQAKAFESVLNLKTSYR